MKYPTILISDDDLISRELLKEILKFDYELIEASSGQETIDVFKKHESELSLILLDMMMPDKDGIQVIKELKEHEGLETPVIFVTAIDTDDIESYSIKAGAVDYIKKPFNADVIKARIAAQISLKQNTDYLKMKIELAVKERTKIIESVVVGLASMVEYRSIESGKHIKRVQEVTRMIIDRLKCTTNMLRDYSPEELSYIVYASALHDIGKIGITDEILLKPGKYTDEEYEKMKEHTVIGYKMAEQFYMGENGTFVDFCKEVCRYHHEKWDGTGYPDGLRGEKIPISARIVAIADAFDAIVSKRVYKESMTHEQALKILEKDSGMHFDAQIVTVMLSLEKELKELYRTYSE